MKTFIAALVTLAVLIFCVVFNCIYISDAVDILKSAADDLETYAEKANPKPLKEAWDRCKVWISLTVSHKETDEIDDTISQIEVHIREKNQNAYASCVASLKCQLSRLAESEGFSLDRIF